jgi:hypothetical protein
MNQHQFPGFAYPPEELTAYIVCGNRFVFSVNQAGIIKYAAGDAEALKQWLAEHHIPDISHDIGTLVYNHFFNNP